MVMMRFLFLTLALLVVIPPAWGAYIPVIDQENKEIFGYDNSYALLVGAWKYTNGYGRLSGVESELDQVGAVLAELGFEVERVENPDHERLRSSINRFIVRRGAKAGNRLLIFFAGHGENLRPLYGGDPTGFLVPVDAPPPAQDRSLFKERALSMEQFGPLARKIDSKHALFVLDCCFSGAVVFAMERTNKKSHITGKMARPVRQFLTAGEDSKTVPDRSEFARVLVDGLKGEADLFEDEHITGTELGMYVQNRLSMLTGERQVPQFGKLHDRILSKGDFVFPLKRRKKKITRGPSHEFYEAMSSVRTLIKKGGDSNLLSASSTLDSWKDRKGSDPVLLTRVGENLQEAFRNLYKDQKPAEPKEVSLTLETTPKWVYVYDGDGKYIGNSEESGMFSLKRKRGTSLKLVFKKKGYLRQEKSLRLDRNTVLQVQLEAKKVLPKTHTNSIDMKFALIPKGTFTMGAPKWEQEKAYNQCVEQKQKESNCKSWYLGNSDQTEVEITRPFYMGKYEVTQGQWKEVMGRDSWKDSEEFKGWYDPEHKNYSHRKPLESGSDYPVVFVSWEEVQEFIKKLNEREGCPSSSHLMRGSTLGDLKSGCYRLPTEAEWEYAARAGTKTVNYWGNNQDKACAYANVTDLSAKNKSAGFIWSYPHKCDDGYPRLAPVGKKKPNPFGLYDTIGNVWEWVFDWYSATYYKRSPTKDPVNLKKGSSRVDRGGSWLGNARCCRSAYRGLDSPGNRFGGLGFRLLRTP